ncbi:MAG: hypothetical protein AAF468_19415 [Pseudomonadota bacterium]
MAKTALDTLKQVKLVADAIASAAPPADSFNVADESLTLTLAVRELGGISRSSQRFLAKFLGIEERRIFAVLRGDETFEFHEQGTIAALLSRYVGEWIKSTERADPSNLTATLDFNSLYEWMYDSIADDSQSRAMELKVKVRWIETPKDLSFREKLFQLNNLLAEIVRYVELDNVPEHERFIRGLEREQFLAVLKTVITMCEAPMMELSILEKLKQYASSKVKKTADAEVTSVVRKLLREASDALSDLLNIFNPPT